MWGSDGGGDSPLLVVLGDVTSPLRRNWIGKLQLDWRKVYKRFNVKGPINPFAWLPELFGDAIGTMKDVKLSIQVNQMPSRCFAKQE